jgi:hypothetical protein
MFVGAKGGNQTDKTASYTAPTASSSNKYSRPGSSGDLKGEAEEK